MSATPRTRSSWHHRRHGTDPADALRRLASWRDAHPLDVVRVIRQIRAAELAS